MSKFEVITAPTGSPVTLDEVKAFIRVTHTLDDTQIQAMIDAAITTVEAFTNRVLLSTVFRVSFPHLNPPNRNIPNEWVELRKSPVTAITSFQVLIDGNREDVAFQRQMSSRFDRLWVDDPAPIVTDPHPEAFQVTFTAGYGTAADVPDALKEAIKRLVAFQYENRDDTTPDTGHVIPSGIQFMARPFRIIPGIG